MNKTPLLLSFILLTAGGIRAQEEAEAPIALPEAEESVTSAAGVPGSESPAAASEAPVIQSEDTASMESKIRS